MNHSPKVGLEPYFILILPPSLAFHQDLINNLKSQKLVVRSSIYSAARVLLPRAIKYIWRGAESCNAELWKPKQINAGKLNLPCFLLPLQCTFSQFSSALSVTTAAPNFYIDLCECMNVTPGAKEGNRQTNRKRNATTQLSRVGAKPTLMVTNQVP